MSKTEMVLIFLSLIFDMFENEINKMHLKPQGQYTPVKGNNVYFYNSHHYHSVNKTRHK
jgi:hypothetical protein